MGEKGNGHIQTLHTSYLLLISPNLEQAEKDVAGVEQTNTSALAPSLDTKPPGSELSGMATSDTMGDMSQGSPDQSAPLRCGTHATQNQLPWRYCNFALLADTSPPSILDAWVGLCIFLHLISCLYTIFCGKYSVNTPYLYHLISARHHSL